MRNRRAMIAIINSGGANLASVRFAFERLGTEPVVTTDPEQIQRADHVILPGVGAAADIMNRLQQLNLHTLIPTLRQPLLGICVGMQVLYSYCEEDEVNTMGVFPGQVQRLPRAAQQPIPHMGWNTLHVQRDNPLMQDIQPQDYAYFVHSYAATVDQFTVATCQYSTSFTAVAQRENFYATQFHPERSAQTGARVLRNFLAIT